ncbi:MAG: sulfotransferase [Chloroflexi bacterium]|nr:sulfotransferase [Chloroflexota bacterium]
MNDESPIFVRGMSRSGGTLLVTLLDCHPAVAMSYELYPNLLLTERVASDVLERIEYEDVPDGRSVHDAGALLRAARAATTTQQLLAYATDRNLRTFLARLSRGGVTVAEFAAELGELARSGLDLERVSGRLELMAACCRVKMRRERKSQWGLKCTNRFEDYVERWPRARFVNIVRDGRDVLASQLHTGQFNLTAAQIGRAWAWSHERFERFAETAGDQAVWVSYERLVEGPNEEIPRLCEALGLAFDARMLDHSSQSLTIFSASHLSREAVLQPINQGSIGRWKSDVKADELAAFMGEAGEVMRRLGYADGARAAVD